MHTELCDAAEKKLQYYPVDKFINVHITIAQICAKSPCQWRDTDLNILNHFLSASRHCLKNTAYINGKIYSPITRSLRTKTLKKNTEKHSF